MKEAVAAAYPQTELQRCIVHQVRNTLKYAGEKNKKEFANIYQAPSEKQHWSVFPSDTALLKALYPATAEISKKWTMPLRDWGKVLDELEIMYPDRLN